MQNNNPNSPSVTDAASPASSAPSQPSPERKKSVRADLVSSLWEDLDKAEQKRTGNPNAQAPIGIARFGGAN